LARKKAGCDMAINKLTSLFAATALKLLINDETFPIATTKCSWKDTREVFAEVEIIKWRDNIKKSPQQPENSGSSDETTAEFPELRKGLFNCMAKSLS
jgi:hypothetical protein